MKYKKLWISLILVLVISFAILLFYGGVLYQEKPPLPKRVLTTEGEIIFTEEDIKNGQSVWQSIGGQEIGSIWGHGAYVAPDWNTDWLHRELMYILNSWANDLGYQDYDSLNSEQQAALKARLKKEIRTNTYNPETKDIIISPIRAEAIKENSNYYASLFGDDPNFNQLRDDYAMPANTIKEKERIDQLNAFFFWTSWATATNRPDSDFTYTTNWPPEELIDNEPIGDLIIWSVISFVLLLAGIGGLTWYYASDKKEDCDDYIPDNDPLLTLEPTPSMKATLKYFWTVTALIIVQVGMGVLTAHYAVEGTGLYGIPIAEWIPYSLTRTWHLQLAIFWIATAWLASGLFIAPAVSNKEPKYQRFGVNFIYFALLVIVAGSLTGQWFAIQQKLGLEISFFFGHQGYEYVDLGRFWQAFLLIGLFLWLLLMGRALWPVLKKPSENRSLLILFFLASAAIPIFYVPGLFYGQQTHLSMAEYWRWWVVHLWVEGFFEVFATVAIAFLFTRMGLIRESLANKAVLFSTIIFLFGGIVGTFHHLYFAGTPIGVMALGATFSALEVVPLVLVGFEAYENLRLSKAKQWVKEYKWPIYFFIGVAFWNLVGAGLFGFFINPPIALYYMQGLNTTPVHAHTALFGVYGMLGIGLMLFCLKAMDVKGIWKTKVIKFSFWSINIGLALQVLLSILPVGLLQTWASVEHGMWYARSSEFLKSDLVQTLIWFRIIGDTIFSIGLFALAYFIVGLKTGWSIEKRLK